MMNRNIWLIFLFTGTILCSTSATGNDPVEETDIDDSEEITDDVNKVLFVNELELNTSSSELSTSKEFYTSTSETSHHHPSSKLTNSTIPDFNRSTTIEQNTSNSTSTTEIATTTYESSSSGTTEQDIISTTTPHYVLFTTPTTESWSSTPAHDPIVPEVKHKKATWSIALFSLLITFAILCTLLYVFRKYMLRKRKLDRQRLLGSQEGFFAGGDSDMGNL